MNTKLTDTVTETTGLDVTSQDVIADSGALRKGRVNVVSVKSMLLVWLYYPEYAEKLYTVIILSSLSTWVAPYLLSAIHVGLFNTYHESGPCSWIVESFQFFVRTSEG